MNKHKSAAQLLIGSIDWAEARLKEVSHCHIAESICMKADLSAKKKKDINSGIYSPPPATKPRKF